MDNSSVVKIYTDGACQPNPGSGGWSAILIYRDKVKEIKGGKKDTTNQQMEITAIVEGLKSLKNNKYPVTVYTDSAYVVNCFKQKWYEKWMVNGWVTSNQTPVANKELWVELVELVKRYNVKIIKVKGHADDHWNNRCDELAKSAIEH